MTDMRCDKCVFWVPPDAGEWGPVRSVMGYCKQTPHDEDMTEWHETDDDTIRVIKPEYADRTAAAYDGSGYSAGLMTKSEHFCAMFKPK